MSGCVNQVLASYNDGMSPEEIAEDQDLDVVAVKAILMQSSVAYRQACRGETKLNPDDPELNFTADQLRRVNQVIYDVALSAKLPDGQPDYRTQLKAATYIRDDIKGRLTPVRNITQTNNFNLLEFNQKLEQAKLGAVEARRLISANSVDVEEVVR